MKYSDFLSCWSCLGAFLEHLEALFESTSCVLFLQLVPEKLLVFPLMSRTVRNRAPETTRVGKTFKTNAFFLEIFYFFC